MPLRLLPKFLDVGRQEQASGRGYRHYSGCAACFVRSVARQRVGIAVTLACLVLALLLSGCSAPDPLPPPDDDAILYVIERGWHTDIGFPVDEIAAPLAALKSAFPGARFLTFGFGERQFVMSRQQTFATMLKALLPSRSVLLMTGLRTTPQDAFGQSNVVVLRLSRAGLARIQAAMWAELEHAPGDDPMLLADGPYPGSVYYAALATYDAMFTCNTWTAQMLRFSNFPMPVVGVVFSGQVMGMARWFGARQARASVN